MARKTVDLNALIENDGGEITIGDKTYRVLPISGAAIKLYRTDTDDQLTKAYKVAGLCVPAMSADEVDQLSPKQVAKILDMALGDVEAVEAEHQEANPDPNGAAPATTSSSPA